MFKPVVIAEYDSKYSGRVVVKQTWDFGTYRYIITGGVIQSGPLVHEIWGPVFGKIARKNQSWLVLGVAGGTILKHISSRYHPSRLVGVEIDPVMVEIGRKYFDTGSIPNLEIVIADARRLVSRLSDQQFNYILVDMYCGENLPKFIYAPAFITRLSRAGGLVVFNHLYYLPEHKTAVEAFIKTLETKFKHIQLVRKYANIFIICSKAPPRPGIFARFGI